MELVLLALIPSNQMTGNVKSSIARNTMISVASLANADSSSPEKWLVIKSSKGVFDTKKEHALTASPHLPCRAQYARSMVATQSNHQNAPSATTAITFRTASAHFQTVSRGKMANVKSANKGLTITTANAHHLHPSMSLALEDDW